jgi:hypothetical protein
MQDDLRLARWAIDQQMAANRVEIRCIQENLLAMFFAACWLTCELAVEQILGGR